MQRNFESSFENFGTAARKFADTLRTFEVLNHSTNQIWAFKKWFKTLDGQPYKPVTTTKQELFCWAIKHLEPMEAWLGVIKHDGQKITRYNLDQYKVLLVDCIADGSNGYYATRQQIFNVVYDVRFARKCLYAR
jgi:hypothetical protein